MASNDDTRPLAAAGHVSMRAHPVDSAARRLEAVGVRTLVVREDFAVLELRGGTHIVLRDLEEAELHEVDFDLMYDDVDAAHALFATHGFETTEIERGNIHDTFRAVAPERFRIRVNSSHASGEPV